jgi:PTH2 family peptidyl-tRNA hydrolase
MKMVIVARKDLKLSKGKLAVQACHAAIYTYNSAMKKCPDKVKAWEREGAKKIVVVVADEKELLSLHSDIPDALPKSMIIHDAGLTHLDPGTATCFALGPYDDEILDRYTGNLKLVN